MKRQTFIDVLPIGTTRDGKPEVIIKATFKVVGDGNLDAEFHWEMVGTIVDTKGDAFSRRVRDKFFKGGIEALWQELESLILEGDKP